MRDKSGFDFVGVEPYTTSMNAFFAANPFVPMTSMLAFALSGFCRVFGETFAEVDDVAPPPESISRVSVRLSSSFMLAHFGFDALSGWSIELWHHLPMGPLACNVYATRCNNRTSAAADRRWR